MATTSFLPQQPKRSPLTPLLALTSSLILVTLITTFLYRWSFVVVPLVLAAFVALILSTLASSLSRLTRLPYRLTLLLVLILVVSLGYLIGLVVYSSFVDIAQTDLSILRRRVEGLLEASYNIGNSFGFDMQKLSIQDFTFDRIWTALELQSLLRSLSSQALSMFATAVLVLLLAVFIMSEQNHVSGKLRAIFTTSQRYDTIQSRIATVREKVQIYVRVKTITGAMTGLCSTIALMAFGVEHAIFWGFLIFLLNFIPNIGSIIGVVLPTIFAWLTIDSWTILALLTIILIAIQQIIGSFLEPKFMGSSLNISPLVVILSLIVWGSLWGLPGMFLCVPMTVILMLVLAQYPQTRAVAVLLSEKGEI